jgi:hypothetical protein
MGHQIERWRRARHPETTGTDAGKAS